MALPAWIVGVLRLLGIRRAADVVPVARELAEQLGAATPPEGQPLPFRDVQHIQRQIESATQPRTGNPSRVAAASAPAAGAVREALGAGAEGTRGRCVRCAECLTPQAKVPGGWGCPNPECELFCPSANGPGVARAVDRTAITTRPRPPRPPPKDRKK